MSISAQSISEEAISGQLLLWPSLIPGAIIYWPEAQFIKTVVQTWPDEVYPEVFNPTQEAP